MSSPISRSLDDYPIYIGTSQFAVAPNVPGALSCGLAGHRYLVDLTQLERNPVPIRRQAQDSSAEPGEQTFDVQGLWRKARSDWSHGAGQVYLDDFIIKPDSRRFEASKGINVWTKRQFSLLHDTARIRTATVSAVMVHSVNGYLYATDDQSLIRTSDPSAGTVSWTTITGTPAASAVDLTSDGNTVYAAYSASGVYKSPISGTSATQLSTWQATLVQYANGRLIAANANVLFEVAADGSRTIIKTHANTSFVWSSIVGAPNGIYATGNGNDKPEIYFIDTDSTGALAPPVWACSLPDGEQINVLAFYGGFMIFGTSRGVRVGVPNDGGAISYDRLIEVTNGVSALEPHGQFVWYSWKNFDSSSTGLGRVDLSEIVESQLVPAHASDLMATTQGAIGSIASWVNSSGVLFTVFTVTGVGIYAETDDCLASGYLDTGRVNFATNEPKAVAFLSLGFDPLVGTIAITITHDDGTIETPQSILAADGTSARRRLDGNISRWVNIRFTLTSATDCPTIHEWVLETLVLPPRHDEIVLPLVFSTELEFQNSFPFEPYIEFAFLRTVQESGGIVTLQLGNSSEDVYIDGISLMKDENRDWIDKFRFFKTTVFVRCVTV